MGGKTVILVLLVCVLGMVPGSAPSPSCGIRPPEAACDGSPGAAAFTGGSFAELRRVAETSLQASQTLRVQRAAIQTVAASGDPAAVEILLASWRNYTPRMRKEVLAAIFGLAGSVAALVDVLEAGEIQLREIDEPRRAVLLGDPDPAVRRRLEALLAGAARPDLDAALAAFRRALKLPGSEARGKALFKANCRKCHLLDGDGVDVGTPLRNLDAEADALLTAIIDPNRSVASEYASYLLETAQGFILSGIIAAETEETMTLRGEGGADHVLARGDIEDLGSLDMSFMPEGLEREMTIQQMADLLRYLKNAGVTGASRIAEGR